MKQYIKIMTAGILTLLVLYSCGPSKKATSGYKDPYEGKTNNELSTTQLYIKTYRDMAISEMDRSGVPASITIAQGILESGNGNSYLARKGRNHFGIKCRGDWKGQKIYLDDDEKDECFRKYNSVVESYKDHSDFLRNNSRYAFLFDLEPTDYKGWAKGLKKAGYATRSNYAELLIDIIEKHQLYIYDKPGEKSKGEKGEVFKYNRIPAVMARAGETYKDIAQAHGIELSDLLDYNDLNKPRRLSEGQIVYLKYKRSKAKESYHIIKEKDRMYSISQEYGVKLESLYQYNKISRGEEPAVGEIVYLKSQRKEPPELRIIVQKKAMYITQKPPAGEVEDDVVEEEKPEVDNKMPVEPDVIEEEIVTIESENEKEEFEEVPVLTGEENETEITPEEENISDILADVEGDVDETEEISIGPPKEKQAYDNKDLKFHFVQKGETLYAISRKYNVTVDEIKKWNKMTSNNLSEGDTLIIQPPSEVTAATSSKTDITSSKTKISPDVETPLGSDTVFHVVQEEESLYMISRKYDLTIVDLIALNKLKEYEVTPGQKLIIKLPEVTASPDPFIKKKTTDKDPFINKKKTTTTKTETGPAVSGKTHKVQNGETLYSISRKYNITVNRLKELNNLASNNLNVGQVLVVGSAPATKTTESKVKTDTKDRKYHVVQVDETLYSISKKYNISVEKIRKLNNLDNNIINVGQKLIIE